SNASLRGSNGSAAFSSAGNTTPRTSLDSSSSPALFSSSDDFEIGSTLAGLRSEIEDLRRQRDELLATAANHTQNREGDEQHLREVEVADARRVVQLTNVNDRIDSIDREWGPLLAAAGVVRDDLDSNPADSIRRLEHEATRIANLLSESERLDSAIRVLEPQ